MSKRKRAFIGDTDEDDRPLQYQQVDSTPAIEIEDPMVELERQVIHPVYRAPGGSVFDRRWVQTTCHEPTNKRLFNEYIAYMHPKMEWQKHFGKNKYRFEMFLKEVQERMFAKDLTLAQAKWSVYNEWRRESDPMKRELAAINKRCAEEWAQMLKRVDETRLAEANANVARMRNERESRESLAAYSKWYRDRQKPIQPKAPSRWSFHPRRNLQFKYHQGSPQWRERARMNDASKLTGGRQVSRATSRIRSFLRNRIRIRKGEQAIKPRNQHAASKLQRFFRGNREKVLADTTVMTNILRDEGPQVLEDTLELLYDRDRNAYNRARHASNVQMRKQRQLQRDQEQQRMRDQFARYSRKTKSKMVPLTKADIRRRAMMSADEKRDRIKDGSY